MFRELVTTWEGQTSSLGDKSPTKQADLCSGQGSSRSLAGHACLQPLAVSKAGARKGPAVEETDYSSSWMGGEMASPGTTPQRDWLTLLLAGKSS